MHTVSKKATAEFPTHPIYAIQIQIFQVQDLYLLLVDFGMFLHDPSVHDDFLDSRLIYTQHVLYTGVAYRGQPEENTVQVSFSFRCLLHLPIGL